MRGAGLFSCPSYVLAPYLRSKPWLVYKLAQAQDSMHFGAWRPRRRREAPIIPL